MVFLQCVMGFVNASCIFLKFASVIMVPFLQQINIQLSNYSSELALRHPKIGTTNFGGILHQSACVRKQKTLKILCFVICVEDYHRLIQTQFLIQSPLGNLTSVIHNFISTRKNAQVVTNLHQTCHNAVPTTCQQDVFALLVPSLLTSCQRLVGNLLRQGC